MKVKLDLHTHVREAFNFQPPSVSIAEKVVAQIKSSGIDGIAITDHNNKDWAFELRDLVEQHYPGEVIIIPGWEVEVRPASNPFDEYQVGELFLPEGGVFRIYSHPGYYSPNILIEDGIRYRDRLIEGVRIEARSSSEHQETLEIMAAELKVDTPFSHCESSSF